MKPYRAAFYIALALNLALLGAIGWWWWRRQSNAPGGATPPATAAAASAAPAAAMANMPGMSAPAAAQPALAPIQLSPQRRQRIGVEIGKVQRQWVHDDLRVFGNVTEDEQKQAYVQTRFSGWIQRVYVNAAYQHVKRGQPLFTIYSPDLLTTEREYLLALQNQKLLARSPVEGVAAGAKSLVNATLERLRQWDLPAGEIARLQRTGQARQYLVVESPATGFITERNALPNQYVQPSTRLYTIADFSTVWVDAQVYQNDLGQVRAGERATLTVDSYPGRRFAGRVNFIYPNVNMSTRTARVRLVFANAGLLLRPGMFVNVDLHIPLGRQLVVPTNAIFQTGTQSLAFLDRGNGYLQPQPVVVGPQAGNDFIVLQGLRQGERIVTSANFLIDSESQLQAAMGSFLPPPPPPGGPSGAAQPRITFSSQPSPPQKGANTFQVKLTDAQGHEINAAQVQAVFFMAAMPAMGMPAQRVLVALSDQGGGIYRGRGELPAEGNWQVTITAQRGGQVIASKQLNLSAGGGR